MRQKLSTTAGFTLIELLVVITIISILSAIGFSLFAGAQEKGRDSVRKSDLNQLALALEGYLQKNSSYVLGIGTSCSSDTANFYTVIALYVDGSVPVDPLDQTQYCYISVNNGRSYRLYAKLENCSDKDIINYSTCKTSDFNYSRVSQDLTVAAPPP